MSADHPHLTEAQIVAYSSGQSAIDGADLHLMGCNECWEAVQADRNGRLSAEGLREVAPPEVRDRIVAAVSCAPVTQRRRWAPSIRLVGAAAGAVLVAASTFLAVRGNSHPGDSPIVSAVVKAASVSSAAPVPSVTGAAGQVAQLSAMELGGVKVVVARSDRAFPMPYRAVPITSSGAPWLAMRGRVTLVCLDAPHPILLAAELPADVLMPLAHRLDPLS
jgi:hypothetical protein